MKNKILLLFCFFSVISCKETLQEKARVYIKKENIEQQSAEDKNENQNGNKEKIKNEDFTFEIQNLGKFELNEKLRYNLSSIDISIKNNSGHDIINGRARMQLDIQIEGASDTSLRSCKFVDAISTKNPWINGQERTLWADGMYSWFSFDKYILQNYEIKKADLLIILNTSNYIIDYENKNTYKVNLKDDLIKFKNTLD